ncbi:VOC family protein [Salinigranum rubrum]|uniref:VOC family protein n=1 Tax=Salinigranum rubrum TaxID=755307 RepID=UPI001C200613|nr:VOC family protein [Salinigranum rubrum]
MSRVTFFEIYADDVERAMAFYESVFDWQFERYEPSEVDYWLVMTGPDDEPGIDGGFMRRPEGMPRVDGASAFVCTVTVESIDDTLERVTDTAGRSEWRRCTFPTWGGTRTVSTPRATRSA